MKYLVGSLVLLFSVQSSASPDSGWEEIKTFGDTSCSRGGDYSFFVRKGSSDKILINYLGGGACWDKASCKVGSKLFVDDMQEATKVFAEEPVGIFDHENEENPFKDYTHIAVPYCTGDIHWGNADVTYDDDLEIRHRGAVNASAVLDYVVENYTEPEKVMVTGCSAGSYGSIYWLPHIKEAFLGSDVRQFGDSGAGVITESFQKEDMPTWNSVDYAPTWIPELDPAQVVWDEVSVVDFYAAIANFYPDTKTSQFSHTGDLIQKVFYLKMRGSLFSWRSKMQQIYSDLEANSPEFESFTSGGTGHCVTNSNSFYNTRSGGEYLHEWLADFIE